MKFLIFTGLVFLLIGCNNEQLENTFTEENNNNATKKQTPLYTKGINKESMTKEEINMVSNKNKTKRGCSGYYFFIQLFSINTLYL